MYIYIYIYILQYRYTYSQPLLIFPTLGFLNPSLNVPLGAGLAACDWSPRSGP